VVVGDSWYATEIDGVRPIDDVLGRLPFGRRLGRVGPVRGLVLFLAGLRAETIVTTNAAPGATTCLVLCGLFRPRRLVSLEYIVHPGTGLRWWYFVVLRRILLRRALRRAQLLSAHELARYPQLHRIPADRFALVRWPVGGGPVGERTEGRRVLASGRRVDWATFFGAAAGADWDVRVVCTGEDRAEVTELARAAGVKPVVRHDIPAEEHAAEVAAATVYVIAVPETGASIGQIRVMNAAEAGVPLVASDVVGLRDYVDGDSAELVPPGDCGALRAAVDGLLADPQRREELRRAAAKRGGSRADYLAEIAALAGISRSANADRRD
jgi:glycosyltransferase involved in cell wall biosynthesis